MERALEQLGQAESGKPNAQGGERRISLSPTRGWSWVQHASDLLSHLPSLSFCHVKNSHSPVFFLLRMRSALLLQMVTLLPLQQLLSLSWL